MAFAICASQDANRLSIQYASDNLRLGLRPGVERNLMSFLFLPLWRYANFSGRASRREFWSFFALSAAVFIAVLILTGLSGEPSTPNRPGEAPPYWIVAYVVWWLATLIPWLAVQVRRFHDQGRTGWLVAVNVGGYLSFPVAPWVGLILIVLSMLLMALPGELGANQYGDSLIDDANADGEENLANQTSLTEAQPKVGASPHKPEVTRYSGRREGGTAIEPGIKLGQDGRFYVHGDAHESLQEAQLASRRGLYSYEALQSRLAENQFAARGLVDMTGPVIRLQNLSPEDFLILLSNIRNVFALGNPAQFLVPDEALTEFMAHCNRRIGEAYFRTPRNTIKAFVQFLAILEQNPSLNWIDLIGDTSVDDDPGDSDEVATDDDDELSSFSL